MSQPPGGINRRAFPRKGPRGVRCRCRKGALGVGPDYALKLLQLSRSGALLLAKEGLAAGQAVELELDGLGRPRPLAVPGVVARAEPAEGGAVRLGVRFDRHLSYADFQLFT